MVPFSSQIKDNLPKEKKRKTEEKKIFLYVNKLLLKSIFVS
jgi:hypothetical protein